MKDQRKIAQRREAVTVLYGQGSSQTEIAAKLKLPTSTVGRDIDAIRKLAQGYQEYAADQLILLNAATRKAAGIEDWRSLAALSAVARRWFSRDPDPENDQPIVWQIYEREQGTD